MRSAASRLGLALLCVVLVAVSGIAAAPPVADSKQQQQQPAAKSYDDERLPLGEDGSYYAAAHECGADEHLAPGLLPTCEPTCADPKPACFRVFFTSIDYVPCFCKPPLVRNQLTKKCVQLSECPPQALAPKTPAGSPPDEKRW